MSSSMIKRFFGLLRRYGLIKTVFVCAAMVDDHYLRLFDRKYGIRTSGHVELSDTSFDASKLSNATSYGPVNGWALGRLLRELNLSKSLHFADLGCGLARPCIIAAEYGFEKVTGVELAPELCATARKNVESCRLPSAQKKSIDIIQGDVFDYCESSKDDVFFVFRAFSIEFFAAVRLKLAERAFQQNKILTMIYTQRLSTDESLEIKSLSGDRAYRKVCETTIWGQEFHVYQCGGPSESK
jgi:SAM-dependent methyltransferase